MMGLRPGPAIFLALLAIELPLVRAAVAARPRVAAAARVAIFAIPLALALALRAWQALTTAGVLDWDETYYLNLAVTGAAGRGLYPYLVGYGPMPILGGIGYAAYAYVLAVRVFGPTVLGLRVVSLLASGAALVFVWLLVRRWYGSAAAWMAAALTAAMRLFVMANTARMDSWTFAHVAGALLLVAIALERRDRKAWHLLAGLAFGLGLEVHIDTVVTAVACGVLYLALWVREARARHEVFLPTALLLYVLGWSAGAVVFLVFNVLPDPAAFYKTTVLLRVDATSWYSSAGAGAAASFMNPSILLAKELTRYGLIFRALPWIEIALAAAGLIAMLVRRSAADRMVLILIGALGVTAAVVLNSPSPLYFIHVTPALVIPAAVLVTHGLTGKSMMPLRSLGVWQLAACAVLLSALGAGNAARTLRRDTPPAAADVATASFVERVHALAGRGCRIAGDGGLYVRYFADYPNFISWRPTEVRYAMLYFGARDESGYWALQQPDVVISAGVLPPGLSPYVMATLHEAAPGIWMRPGGCGR
ncbi:MAG TPA: glycosyltransferase family 39 protein [Vicinamibacterales bacterium]|nr:glycosyltransferase family 39 protein [Vicinamibacterales bacterium]